METRNPPPRGRDPIDVALQVPAAIIVVVMTLHVTANAVLRAYFQSPIRGTLEYTQYWYLPAIAFVGLVVAQRHHEHVEARLLFNRFPERAQPVVQLATQFLTLTVCVLFAYFTFEMARRSLAIGRTGGVIGVTIWPATFLVPIGFAMLAVQLAVDAARSIARLREHTAEPAEAEPPLSDGGGAL